MTPSSTVGGDLGAEPGAEPAAGRTCVAAETTADLMRTVFETNVFGLVRVTHAFLPLLQRSAAPVVVILSSGLGSLTRVTTPGRQRSSRQDPRDGT